MQQEIKKLRTSERQLRYRLKTERAKHECEMSKIRGSVASLCVGSGSLGSFDSVKTVCLIGSAPSASGARRPINTLLLNPYVFKFSLLRMGLAVVFLGKSSIM